MSGHQQAEHSVDSTATSQSTRMNLPEVPSDRTRSTAISSSLRSALLSRDSSGECDRKRVKTVRWDFNVLDSQHMMQSGTEISAADAHPPKMLTRSSVQPAPSKSTTANASTTFDDLVARQQPKSAIESRRPMPTSTQEHSRARPSQTALPKANFASKRAKLAASKIRNVLPAAPDAPTCRPPPAPRPSRLPTPDLPEINETKFFVPKEKLSDYYRWKADSKEIPGHMKTDEKLDAARAYIQERKRRGF